MARRVISRHMSTAGVGWTRAVGVERDATAEYKRRQWVEVCKQQDSVCQFWQWPTISALSQTLSYTYITLINTKSNSQLVQVINASQYTLMHRLLLQHVPHLRDVHLEIFKQQKFAHWSETIICADTIIHASPPRERYPRDWATYGG